MSGKCYSTQQKLIVLRWLAEREGQSFRASEVASALVSEEIAPATVYRRLEHLVREGHVVKVPSGKRSAEYVFPGLNGKVNA